MDRKIFKADNIQQAIANIKEELGSDALILNTRKIPKKPLDPYAKEMVEVEAQVPGKQYAPPKNENFAQSIKEDIAQIKDIISIAGFVEGNSPCTFVKLPIPHQVCVSTTDQQAHH